MSKQSLIEKIVTKDTLDFNSIAFESINYYKEAKELLDETYFVLGKSNSYETATASTSTLEIKCHAQLSTTLQKI